MKEEDYKMCYYIDQEMRFYTFEDFLKNAKCIKRMYQVLNHKIFYKWYVYSHVMGLKRKDRIWEYLNGDIEYEILEVS